MQQLEALVKMKPSEEEEKKLMDYNGGISILDPAENFVKVLLTIPMAFSRIEAMLYKETFDDEVAHLRMSFTLIKVSGAISINIENRNILLKATTISVFTREPAVN